MIIGRLLSGLRVPNCIAFELDDLCGTTIGSVNNIRDIEPYYRSSDFRQR